jgi:hypothetical protein
MVQHDFTTCILKTLTLVPAHLTKAVFLAIGRQWKRIGLPNVPFLDRKLWRPYQASWMKFEHGA